MIPLVPREKSTFRGGPDNETEFAGLLLDG